MKFQVLVIYQEIPENTLIGVIETDSLEEEAKIRALQGTYVNVDELTEEQIEFHASIAEKLRTVQVDPKRDIVWNGPIVVCGFVM